MRVLLFGANGQVGNELRRTLLPHGELISLTRQEVDLTDLTALKNLLVELNPDVIVNAAAYTAVDKAESQPELASAINCQAVTLMADIATANNALLIHYSTDYVFDGESVHPYSVDAPTCPKSVYGQTKLAGEQAIIDSGCKHLIFRTSWVYSAHGHNFVKTMIRFAQEKEALKVVADQIGTPTSAELIADVTSLALAAYEAGRLDGGLYHLTAAGETSWYNFAIYLLQQAENQSLQLKVSPNKVQPLLTAEYPTPASRPANSRLDTTKLEKALNIKMPNWKVHVDRVVQQLAFQMNK